MIVVWTSKKSVAMLIRISQNSTMVALSLQQQLPLNQLKDDEAPIEDLNDPHSNIPEALCNCWMKSPEGELTFRPTLNNIPEGFRPGAREVGN